MTKFLSKKSSGYVALTSILVISFLMMILVFAVNFSGFYFREGLTDYYLKEVSRELAEGCAYAGLLKLTRDKDYLGNETILVSDSESCQINSVSVNSLSKDFQTSAASGLAFTKISISANSTTLEVISWQEVL